MTTRPLLPYLLLALLSGCSYTDNVVITVEEPITSLFLVLTPDTGQKVIMHYMDHDGEGGMEPIILGGTLQANTRYTGELLLRNALNGKMEHFYDSTSVAEQAALHQVFYAFQGNGKLTTTYTDMDENGNPFGLQTTVQTEASCEGRWMITVVHGPDKLAPGVAEGDITHSGGSIDAQVVFEVVVR